MLTEQTKQAVRAALAADFAQSNKSHRHWVEDVCDEPNDDIWAIINATPDDDQDELTDFLHEAMSELNVKS